MAIRVVSRTADAEPAISKKKARVAKAGLYVLVVKISLRHVEMT